MPDEPCPNCSSQPNYRQITSEEYNIFGIGCGPGVSTALWALGTIFKSVFTKGPLAAGAEIMGAAFAKGHKSMGVVICMSCQSFVVKCPYCQKVHTGRAGYLIDRYTANCVHCNNIMSD